MSLILKGIVKRNVFTTKCDFTLKKIVPKIFSSVKFSEGGKVPVL